MMQITNSRYVNDAGWYDVTVTPDEGEPFEYTVAPDDPAPMAVAIRQMMADTPMEIAPYEPVPEPIDLIAYSAQKRWEIETGGIEFNGQAIDTSRESQSMIAGAYAYSQANPDEVIQFKSASGWVALDAATMAAIATAVGSYVQACFALEASVAAAITDGTITTTAEIDAAFA